MDLTTGRMGKSLVLFAIPLLLSSLVQQLYNTVDLIFVGNLIDKSASAAIGASSQLIACLVGFFGGLSVGCSVVVSHIFGAGDEKGLERAVHTAVVVSVLGGVLFLAIGFVIAPLYMELVNTPQALQASAIRYLRIYLLSLMSMFLYNLGSGVLRAMGDSKSPLYAQLVGGLTNVAADYLLIRGCANGIDGVAWATVLSQTVAAAMTLYYLSRLEGGYAFSLRRLGVDPSILKRVLRIGLPAGVQALVISFSNVIVSYHVNSLGEDVIAAFAAYFKVELLIYLPIVAFGQAAMTFSGQNTGAGKGERVQRGALLTLALAAMLALVSGLLALSAGGVLFRIFNKEAEVIAIGRRIIAVTFPWYFLYAVLQILGDALRGTGRVAAPMYIVMINLCVVRSFLLFVLVPQLQSVESVALVYPITWALTAVCMAIYFGRSMRSNRRGS